MNGCAIGTNMNPGVNSASLEGPAVQPYVLSERLGLQGPITLSGLGPYVHKLSVIGSVVGALFVAFNFAFIANVIWAITNPLLVFYNYKIGEKHQADMFAVFALIAIYGVLRGAVL